MLIRCGYEIGFEYTAPTPMLLMINVRPERQKDLRTPETLRLDPVVPNRLYIDGFGNLCTRLVAPAGVLTLSCDFVIEDSGLPDPIAPDAQQHGSTSCRMMSSSICSEAAIAKPTGCPILRGRCSAQSSRAGPARRRSSITRTTG